MCELTRSRTHTRTHANYTLTNTQPFSHGPHRALQGKKVAVRRRTSAPLRSITRLNETPLSRPCGSVGSGMRCGRPPRRHTLAERMRSICRTSSGGRRLRNNVLAAVCARAWLQVASDVARREREEIVGGGNDSAIAMLPRSWGQVRRMRRSFPPALEAAAKRFDARRSS